MKIREFSIVRYGPLPNIGRIILHTFNLFFGKNEDGKTLTIDALVKLLLGKNAKIFDHIDRVEENAEGYVLIEYDKGKEVKLPEKGNFSEVIDVTSSECRNIFVIRNSDLSIARESDFYTNVTDRLTGLRTEEISKIREMLREIGKITPSGIFRDVKDERLKTRIDDTRELLGGIEILGNDIQQERFDELEEKSARYGEKIDEIKRKIEDVENARKREKYTKGREALNSLKRSLERFKDLDSYNENDERSWRDCERDIQRHSEEREALYRDLEENEKHLEEVRKKLEGRESNFRVLVERKKKLDEEIKPELKHYKAKIEALEQKNAKNNVFTLSGIICSLLLGICLLGIIIRPSLLFSVLAVVLSVLVIVFWIFKFQLVREKAWCAAVFKRIKLTTSKFELDAENVEGILSNIQKFDEEYSKQERDMSDSERHYDLLNKTIEVIRVNRIPEIGTKIKGAENKIQQLQRQSGIQTLQEYKERFRLKRNNEGEKNRHLSILESHFRSEQGTIESMIAFWEKEIKALEAYEDKAMDVIFDEAKEKELKEERRDLEEKKGDIFEKMIIFQEQLKEIERKANEILRGEEYLHCKTSIDLEAVRGKLQKFIEDNEINKDLVLKSIKIFEDMEAEEKARISELFGSNSFISNYFHDITDGLYEAVFFNQERGTIEVMRKDGVILEAEKLSGGAYDQLYFSIRVALGEKVLKGKKGFFIMDDPFIKADKHRLQRQIEMLHRITEWGWQILYFSAKSEIKDLLQGKIDQGDINFIEIQGIYA